MKSTVIAHEGPTSLGDYFLHGQCASFAIAAVRILKRAGLLHVGISVLIDQDGEPNTADGRCAYHAYASCAGFDFDAAGIRQAGEMILDFDPECSDTDGPFDEDDFRLHFCGEDGLPVCESDITLAHLWISDRADLQTAIAAQVVHI